MHSVWILWGKESTVAQNPQSCLQRYDFNTAEELNAFLMGIYESANWEDFTEFNTEKAAKERVAEIVGEEEAEEEKDRKRGTYDEI